MPDQSNQLKLELANKVLEAYKFEYKDYSAWWDNLERKAQGTIAIAGIILAGGFAFVRQISENKPLFHEQLLLIGVVLLLLGAIAFAVISLIVREVQSPPKAGEIAELAQEILETKDVENLSDRVAGIVYDQSNLWKECNQKLYDVCKKKGKNLSISQVLVLLATAMISAVTISEVF